MTGHQVVWLCLMVIASISGSSGVAAMDIISEEYNPSNRLLLRRAQSTERTQSVVDYTFGNPAIPEQKHRLIINKTCCHYLSESKKSKHVFTVVAYTFELFLTDLRFVESLGIFIRDPMSTENGKNAFYARAPKRIELTEAFEFDVIAHETGHAILDAVNPYFWDVMFSPDADPFISFQLKTLHEAFADSVAVLACYSSHDGFLSEISMRHSNLEEIGAIAPLFDHHKRNGLRNPFMENDYSLYVKDGRFHDFSQSITRVVLKTINAYLSNLIDTYPAQCSINRDFTKPLREALLKSYRNAALNDNVLKNVVCSFISECGLTEGAIYEEFKQNISALRKTITPKQPRRIKKEQSGCCLV